MSHSARCAVSWSWPGPAQSAGCTCARWSLRVRLSNATRRPCTWSRSRPMRRRGHCSCTRSTRRTPTPRRKMIADEGLADHIDMNFGCPVPKVTRRGGGAALPYKRRLFGQIVAAAVRATEGTDIPVTVKFRIGIDDDPPHPPRRRPDRRRGGRGRRRAACPHRSAALLRQGRLGPDRGAQAARHDMPVLGNGDIFEADDALDDDGRDGVRRRGHRPRLPGQALAVRRIVGGFHRRFERPPRPPSARSRRSCCATASYCRPFRRGQGHARHPQAHRLVPARLPRRRRAATSISAGQDACRSWQPWLDQLDPEVPFPAAATGPRGRQGSAASVALPEGWLADPDDCTVPAGAEVMHSGG